MIPFHKKLCSRCHTIPHAKVKTKENSDAEIDALHIEMVNLAGMVGGATLRWDEYPFHRCTKTNLK